MREDGLQILNSWVNLGNEIRELQARLDEKREEYYRLETQLSLTENAAIYENDQDHIQAALALAEVKPTSRNVCVTRVNSFLKYLCASLNATLRASVSGRCIPRVLCLNCRSGMTLLKIELTISGRGLPNTKSFVAEDQPYLAIMRNALAQSGLITIGVSESAVPVLEYVFNGAHEVRGRELRLDFWIRTPRSRHHLIELGLGIVRCANALGEQVAQQNALSEETGERNVSVPACPGN